MNPKKFRDHIDIAAEATNNSEIDVKNIWGFYWEDIRRELPKMPGLHVRIIGLGDFDIKYWLIDKKIKSVESKTSKNPVIIAAYEQQLKRLYFLRDELKNEREKEAAIKLKRKLKDEVQPGNIQESLG